MILTSPSFEENAPIPSKFTCEGGNINPELGIQNVPDKTQSLALIVEDPDAPMGIFTHWIVWNIDPKTSIIKQESRPPGGTEGKNDAGNIGYIGPCPPSGMHHYHFKLYALDGMLNILEGSTKSELLSAMEGHVVAETELLGTYQKHL